MGSGKRFQYMKKLLAIFAHPDDEAFGPGGSLARYASEGVEIHLLCATKGEAGEHQGDKVHSVNNKAQIGHTREKELLRSAEILGIAKTEFLDFVDGTLCNALYHKVAEKIIKKIEAFRPQVIVTTDRLGVSGHLDHIAVSMITTYSFKQTNIAKKLYYHCLPKNVWDTRMEEYFVYFPEGYDQSEITTRIDFSSYWAKKVAAMLAHQSQIQDVRAILTRWEKLPKVDHFILRYYHGKIQFPEVDMFSCILK